MRKKLFTLLLAMVVSVGSLFASTQINGLYYNLNFETKTAEVTSNSSKYSGTIIIPASVTYNGATYSVTSIGDYAFYGSPTLISAIIGDSVKYIGYGAFGDCSALESIKIGRSVTSIEHAIYRCSKLETVEINSDSIVSIQYSPSSAGIGFQKLFGQQVNLYIIGDDVKSIGDNAFAGCSNLTSVIIGKNVTNIGSNAFHSCTGLTTVVLPDKVTDIGSGAFGYCSGLASFDIPNNVINIGNYAFRNCSNLTSVSIGNNVTSIGDGAFYECVKLDSVNLPCSVENIGENAFYGCGEVSRSCNKDIVQNLPMHFCSEDDIPEWVLDIILRESPNASFPNMEGTYVFRGKTTLYDDSIVNVIVTTGTKSHVQLPDTTVCYGGWVSLSGTYEYRYVDPFEQSQWGDFYNEFASEEFISEFMEMGSQTDYYQWYAFQKYWENYTKIHGECDEQTRQGFETWYKSHFHDYASSCPEGVEYVRVSSDGERFYSSRTLIRTYTNSHGCDSTVSRNVIVSKAVAPKIIATPEQDTFNSGTIRIYNKYCTGSEYYDDQYNYIYKNAEYDYFTINGTKYDFSSAIEGEYNEYYHPDGIRVIDEPSTVIDNLHGGNYHIVFYSACDSVEEYIEIQQYGIEVDGIYYKFQEPYTFSYGGETYEFPGEATVTYRGTSSTEYDEYSGDIVIPESVVLKGVTYIVQRIGNEAFYKCVNLSSITLLGSKCKLSQDYIYTRSDFYYVAYSGIIYGYNDNSAWGSGQVARTTIPIYVPYGSLNFYKEQHPTGTMYGTMNFHIINPHRMTNIISSTTATILFDYENAQHISSCGIDGGEEFAGNVIEHTGLEPNHNYTDVSLFVKTIEGDYDTIHYSFTTTALELTTQPSKTVSATTAILLAETNMSDAEVSCGFEWKRENAPDAMEGTKVYCPVANGQMAGRLKGLKDDVYYKYRAFYQSAAGNMYYGDWQYIFTGDATVEFDPILYTYGASVVTENEATVSGYALAGSEDFDDQGLEYWAESRVNGQRDQVPSPRRMVAGLNEHFFVPASGIKMTVTLTDLDEGTVYKYRVYGKVGDQYYYGTEQTFTTKGVYEEEIPTSIEEVPSDPQSGIKAQKILRDGQIFILRGEKEYTITGQEVR